MLRKIVFVLVALALPFVAATAAGADDHQYPPTGGGSTVPEEREAPPAEALARSSGQAPLARTGTDVTPIVAVGLVLVAGGAVALVASRRRGTSALPA